MKKHPHDIIGSPRCSAPAGPSHRGQRVRERSMSVAKFCTARWLVFTGQEKSRKNIFHRCLFFILLVGKFLCDRVILVDDGTKKKKKKKPGARREGRRGTCAWWLVCSRSVSPVFLFRVPLLCLAFIFFCLRVSSCERAPAFVSATPPVSPFLCVCACVRARACVCVSHTLVLSILRRVVAGTPDLKGRRRPGERVRVCATG